MLTEAPNQKGPVQSMPRPYTRRAEVGTQVADAGEADESPKAAQAVDQSEATPGEEVLYHEPMYVCKACGREYTARIVRGSDEVKLYCLCGRGTSTIRRPVVKV